ncbi:protein-arginine deiminase domain-containing protein [Streptomyces cinnabarinus]|uniref:Protein-arginine deiminase domain-containing protein n=1 Tax=Streptomyces cinnabarinus TaxID=67287 RepID=A0ABY7K655_9ACTN|nr:protein-arginine deiminase domain-containing protein [Streptomyces cinnabarinus]WAZ19982.1 protein-arginine deiminase domain-containing protein [Streptomyces cinnabarinus]
MRTKHAARAVLALTATGAVLAPPATASAEEPLSVDLRADVDRDGRVDLTGGTDTAGEDTWAVGRGAVFLPNIDDDSKRCATTGPGGRPLSDAKLIGCNDATDQKVNGRADAADLARVRSVPMRNLPSDAKGSVKVTKGAAQSRVFVKRDGAWKLVTAQTRLTRAELRAGVEFGVEGKDVIRDSAKWDGRVSIRLKVTSSSGTASDTVTLRAAPLLTHHALQNTQQLLVTKVPGNEPWAKRQRAFVKNLEKEGKAAGITKPLVTFEKYGDIWAQDFVEPAYLNMTGPDGRQRTMRVMLRSAQDREAGRELYEKLRGPNVGVVQAKGRDMQGWETLNSFGNLETIPPYTHNGRSFPAGRNIMGERKDGSGVRPSKEIRTLLKSQGLQDPLLLDTSWLHVGHVDEFVQFLPADTPRGWRIGIADPQAGLQLLRDAQRDGNGAKKMFSVPGFDGTLSPTETIDEALASRYLVSDNEMAAKKIAANLDILKRETGVTDEEIVRVPALYTRGIVGDSEETTRMPLLRRLGGSGDPEAARKYGQQQLAERAPSAAPPAPTVATSAYVPGAVNGILLSRDRYLAPRQWGPVIGGKDIFTEAVTAAYTRAGMKVSYVDDWYTYHLGMGEIHCGTNTLRDASGAWWKPTP